jgi:type IV pilus assembly protein PilN
MIRINLLPTKRKKKAKPVPKFIILAVGLAGLFIILAVLTVNYYNGKIKELENQKAANAKKIVELNKKIAEVKDFEARNRTFEQRKKIIEELSANQSMPAKILDEFASRLSKGVWISVLSISRGTISMSGTGFTNRDIVDFVENLKRSPMFDNVMLGGTSSTAVQGTSVYNFSISMQVIQQNSVPAGGQPGHG